MKATYTAIPDGISCHSSEAPRAMKRPPKRRYQLYLSADLAERLEALAAKPGSFRSTILEDAVQAWLTRQGTRELDDRFGQRLDRISKQLGRIFAAAELRLGQDPQQIVRISRTDKVALSSDEKSGTGS